MTAVSLNIAGSLARDRCFHRTERGAEKASLEVCTGRRTVRSEGKHPSPTSDTHTQKRRRIRTDSFQIGNINLDSILCCVLFVGPGCSAPESNLELLWAFGFNSTASRGAVHYTVKGNVVAGSGSTGVVTHQVRIYEFE